MNWIVTDYGYKAEALGGEFKITRTPGRRFNLSYEGPHPPLPYAFIGATSLKFQQKQAEDFVLECQKIAAVPPPEQPGPIPVPEVQPASAPEPAADPDLDPGTIAEPMPVNEPAPTTPGPVPPPIKEPAPNDVPSDREPLDAKLDRLQMYRDFKWLPRGRSKSVRRYRDIRTR